MQITRQADYALRAMMYLALNDEGKRAATSQIAKARNIPPSFLAKIISQLSIAGLITTMKGARGGVSLARPADQINVLEVIEAIDGPILLNDCTGEVNKCPFGDECLLRPLWREARDDLTERLRSTNFAQFIAKQKQTNAP